MDVLEVFRSRQRRDEITVNRYAYVRVALPPLRRRGKRGKEARRCSFARSAHHTKTRQVNPFIAPTSNSPPGLEYSGTRTRSCSTWASEQDVKPNNRAVIRLNLGRIDMLRLRHLRPRLPQTVDRFVSPSVPEAGLFATPGTTRFAVRLDVSGVDLSFSRHFGVMWTKVCF